MNFVGNFTQAVFVLAALIALAKTMNKKGFFNPEHGSLFARIVTDITVPALIFSCIAVQKISPSQIQQAFVMGGAEIICIALAWGIGCILKLTRPQKGAFILVSSFGSSAFLGYSVIKEVFPNNSAAMADAVITSELGVGVFIFTLGVIIAMYFGSKGINPKEGALVFLNFLKSPIFIALSAGLAVSIFFPGKDNIFFQTLIKFTRTLGAANTVFVAFTIGIILKFEKTPCLLPLIFFVCILKLVLKPVLVAIPSDILHFPLLWKKIVIIEAAMPSAALAVVFSDRYGCDSRLAGRLLIATLICSIFTMVGITAVLLR